MFSTFQTQPFSSYMSVFEHTLLNVSILCSFISFFPTPFPWTFPPYLRCGDEIMEINDTAVYNMVLNDVYAVLSRCTPGPVHIIISRHPDPKVCIASVSCTLTSAYLWAHRAQGTGQSLVWFRVNVDSWVQLWASVLLAWLPPSVRTPTGWTGDWRVYVCVCGLCNTHSH